MQKNMDSKDNLEQSDQKTPQSFITLWCLLYSMCWCIKEVLIQLSSEINGDLDAAG